MDDLRACGWKPVNLAKPPGIGDPSLALGWDWPRSVINPSRRSGTIPPHCPSSGLWLSVSSGAHTRFTCPQVTRLRTAARSR